MSMHAPDLTARRVAVDPTLPVPAWKRETVIDEHIRAARTCVRQSLRFDAQREYHAIYLNQDDVDYLRECASAARVEAREHITAAIAAGWRRNARQEAA